MKSLLRSFNLDNSNSNNHQCNVHNAWISRLSITVRSNSNKDQK